MRNKRYIAIFFLAFSGFLFGHLGKTFWNVLGCERNPASKEYFIATCGGDYEHRWYYYRYNQNYVRYLDSAKIIFLGSSTIQMAIDRTELNKNFKRSYYLLGFSFGEGYGFSRLVLANARPKPEFTILNLDKFFSKKFSVVAKDVMTDTIVTRFLKHAEFLIVDFLLSHVKRQSPVVMGSAYRSVRDGGWKVFGSPDLRILITKKDRNSAKLGKPDDGLIAYIKYLKTISKNVVLTQTPQKGGFENDIVNLSRKLGVDYFIDNQSSYLTMDGTHLSPSSAKLWTTNLVHFLKNRYQVTTAIQ